MMATSQSQSSSSQKEIEELRNDGSRLELCPLELISSVAYHEKLNVILVGTRKGRFFIVDPTLREVLCTTTPPNVDGEDWNFGILSDKLIVVNKDLVGIRAEYNGILLLGSILQREVSASREKVQIELSKTEAEIVCQSLSNLESVDLEVTEVLEYLQSVINKDVDSGRLVFCAKKEKWNTVKLELPVTVIRTCMQSLVQELLKKNRYIPQLSIASSILERLNMLHPPSKIGNDLVIDKTQMFSERVRLETFASWPHTDYKWALPNKMSEAGFYYHPSANGDDRALCFSCSVCLVSWEMNDEPWSEHERHSPFCPFVQGKPTHNVPISLTYATAPATQQRQAGLGKPILGASSFPGAAAVAYSNGHFVVWDILKEVKKVAEIEVNPKDMKCRKSSSSYCDIALRPKEAWVIDTSGPLNDTSHVIKESLKSNVNATESVTLTAVAVLGTEKPEKPIPPSILVGGYVVRDRGLVSQGDSCIVPFLVVYALGSNVIPVSTEHEQLKIPDSFYTTTGNTGTKQESQTFEEDAFTSFISDAELMSDSVSIFSDLNMSDSSATGHFLEFPGIMIGAPSSGQAPPALQKKKGQSTAAKKSEESIKLKSTEGTATVLRQHVTLPTVPDGRDRTSIVQYLLPASESDQVFVVIESKKKNEDTATETLLLLYNVETEEGSIRLSENYVSLKKLAQTVTKVYLFTPDPGVPLFVTLLKTGGAMLWKSDFTLSSLIPRPGFDITSVSYVSSLERLCCGTSAGTLEFYSTNSAEADAFDSSYPESNFSGDLHQSSTFEEPVLLVNQPYTPDSLKMLQELTNFENIRSSFSVNVSSCWQSVVAAQKERKHPQHLRNNENEYGSTKTWKLQRNKHSHKEHLFEITLQKSAKIGHLDLKFLLQSGIAASSVPVIEITLYRQNKTRIASSSQLKNKPATDEFLKSLELVCGPLDLGSSIDLSGQGGTVVMTSPVLVLSKGRNFYLHVKYIKGPESEEPGDNTQSPSNPIPKPPSPKKVPSAASQQDKFLKKMHMQAIAKAQQLKSEMMWGKGGELMSVEFFPPFPPHFGPHPHSHSHVMGHKSGMVGGTCREHLAMNANNDEKRKDLVGCDILDELSLTIRQVKQTDIPNEDCERKALLTSDLVAEQLLGLTVFEQEEVDYTTQWGALDILIWIAAINLSSPPIDNSSYQQKLLKAVQGRLEDLIMQALLMSDRSTAHKCAKLLVLCIEASENFCDAKQSGDGTFSQSLLLALLRLLPHVVSCVSAGSLQWYFLLLNRVRGEDIGMASDKLLHFLKEVSSELQRRSDPLHSLLRTRFGLYQTPLEPELFELEIPPITKSYSQPLTYAGLYGAETLHGATGSGTFQLWGLKDVDFRDLLVGNPLHAKSWGKHLGSLSPKQQIHGLLEVEPLHFVCHAASDGTRIEKIDLGVAPFPAASVASPYEPFTNLQTGEGSKKSNDQPGKMDQVMMLQKSLNGGIKLNPVPMEGADVMFDYLDKFDIPYTGIGNPDFLTALTEAGQIAGNMVTMVMKPSSMTMSQNTNTGKITSIYSPVPLFHSVGIPPIPPYSLPPPPAPPQTSNTNLPKPPATPNNTNSAAPTGSSKQELPSSSSAGNDGLRLLLSPWQQIMYSPPQQAIVIEKMHSGARRYVVLDFGGPVLLTDMVIPSCKDLVSISIDYWLIREDKDGKRLIVATDIGSRTLVVSDLQPAAICRYLKITMVGRYGMSATKVNVALGLFYGHTTILPRDVTDSKVTDVTVLSPVNVQTHLSVLSYLVEDIGCRYQLACSKLRRLLEPLLKPEISSIDHMSYYLPKGKERNKLGLNSSSDQTILLAYQECITLQQQFNTAKNVVKRLQKACSPVPLKHFAGISEIATDKIRMLSEFLIETLLGISFVPLEPSMLPYSLYSLMNQDVCESLFRNICVLENGQCQLSASVLLMRICSFQPWWGKFLGSTLKQLFSSSSNYLFPQDRVFILLVFLGQKSLLNWQNSNVLETALELLLEVISPVENSTGFLSSKLDMTLLGWVIMYLCMCLDGVNCTLVNGGNGGKKDTKGFNQVACTPSRWDFVQGESALYRRIVGPNKFQEYGGIRRRIQKKMMVTKQKLEELDNVASGLSQPVVGLGMQLSALGNKIENIKQKQASIGKNLKLQSSKHFKDLLQIRRSEMLLKRASQKDGGEGDDGSAQEVEINLNLNPTLCLQVARNLAIFLLRMDSTCHSDIFLVTCKSLARIATACRPAIPIGSIFTPDALISLILSAVGSDFIRQKNWSSAWISHAVMCLVQDILDGERMFPRNNETESPIICQENIVFDPDETLPLDACSNSTSEEKMATDDVDADQFTPVPMDVCSLSGESDESDIEEISVPFSITPEHMKGPHGNKRSSSLSLKRLSTGTHGVSTALDARLENGVESTTEIRLRMMAVVDTEILSQSLKGQIEVPGELLKRSSSKSDESNIPHPSPPMLSSELLSECFEKIFQMMASENCSISIEKVLQLWISINVEPGTTDTSDIKPRIPLSPGSISSLIMAFTKNSGIGVQEWGLAFQCLHLVSNQRNSDSSNGMWHYIMTDQFFPDLILKFISGTGMHQKNHIVSAGPTVCQHFYNFLLRLRHLSADTPWTGCLKEILLRVLSQFLSGPFITTNFPIDAFNKFLDRLTCPDFSYLNPATVVNLVQQLAQILHQYVFCPNKLTVKAGGEMKSIHATTNTNSDVSSKQQTHDQFDTVMFRMVSFMASFVTLPYKTTATMDQEVRDFLRQLPTHFQMLECENSLVQCLSKCEKDPRTIADLVLQMDSTMMRIMSVLANPNNVLNVLASGDLSSAFNIMETSVPTTVVDAVIHLFCKIQNCASNSKWLIEPIFKFLAKTPYDDFCCPYVVSETFVLMLLKVISSPDNLMVFVDLKCIEAICDKFVVSGRRFFSSCPTFVSVLTQYLGRTDTNALFGNSKKIVNESVDSQEGQINVAPLGTITSTNFSAHPSEILLQCSPPHRRARAPVWAYHFFPEETYLELVITLPCAVLLQSVHVIPHMTSLSTCPSAIGIEISRDRSTTLPMDPPVNCSGMSNIVIELVRPEVCQTVLLRLFKPKDSNNLGLSQIRLYATTTFSEAALQGLSAVDSVKSFESSAHWLYVLDRAIQVASENNTPIMCRQIIETAVKTPDVLESCYSMLIATVANGKAQDVYLPHVASVLFQFGSLRYEVSKQLMEALLGPVHMGFTHGMIATSVATTGLSQLNTVVELLYKLCCDVPQWGLKNLTAMTSWVESCADNSVANVNSIASPEYFQALAAALWSIATIGKTDLNEICTPQLLWKLYKWSLKLDGKSELKIALDHVMCSICYSKPWLYLYLLTRMQVLKPMDWIEQSQTMEELIYQWYDEDCIWDRLQVEDFAVLRSNLTINKLMTLGRVSQSPPAARHLQNSQFLKVLNSSIMDFWRYTMNRWSSNSVEQMPGSVISSEELISILAFYAELSNINSLKSWFGENGSDFWLPLLNLLSSLPGTVKAACFGTNMYDLESVVIDFLAKCCWSHPSNQRIIANCLREIILSQKVSPHKAVFLHSMSSFCRRLLIQLLLDNEKIIVHVKSSSKFPLKVPANALQLKDRHPSQGVSGGDRLFCINTYCTASDIMTAIEPRGIKLEKMAIAAVEPNRFLKMFKKEHGLVEAGLEMIDQMQMAMQSGNAAKDKRSPMDLKRPFKLASKKLRPEGSLDIKFNEGEKPKGPILRLELEEFPDVKVPHHLSVATYMAAVQQQRPDAFFNTLVFVLKADSCAKLTPPAGLGEVEDPVVAEFNRLRDIPGVFNLAPLRTTVEVFSAMGGLGLLAKHLPIVYPETLRQIAVGSKFTGAVGLVTNNDKESPMAQNDNDWVKIENADDFYDEMFDSMVASTPLSKRAPGMKQIAITPGIPPHSMFAFGLFLGLPRFSEILLGERIGAQCMLRLVLGVTDDADGNDIFNSAIAETLPTLPFQVLTCLLDTCSTSCEEGKKLRRVMVDVKALNFILACLSIFTHQSCDPLLIPGLQHELVIAATKAQAGYTDGKGSKSDDKSHVYWAKGTGFGTGSTAQSWDVEMATQKKKHEEANITCLLQLLSSYIYPKIARNAPIIMPDLPILPDETLDLLRSSCLFNDAIAGYLRNDSVLDISRHIPLYKAVLEFLRCVVSSPQLIQLLAPWERKSTENCISTLLSKMKDVVENYSKRLTSNLKGKSKSKQQPKVLDDDDESLAALIPDIQMTATLVKKAVAEVVQKRQPDDIEMGEDGSHLALVPKTVEERYIEEMKKMQFAFYEMITEDEDGGGIRFTVPYHYESNVRTHWTRSSPARLKRLAQESVTLSTSLPLSHGSTIFCRSDNDCLSVMKVLITGPSCTPYSNGCFEFDIFFPNDYPQSPMLINLETNGRQRVRFNPNLYTDGKVCLSILNTWHGRPEEKWNPQTSSLLPVLVAIQSLILNAEPYFNEPGYEKSRGTEQGERNSKEYNVGIQIATLEWAMLDQLRHSSPCFKDVIQRHFWVKRAEITAQLDQWLEEITLVCRNDKRAGKSVTGAADPVAVYKNNLALLKKELANLKPPSGLEDLADLYVDDSHCQAPPSSPTTSTSTSELLTASSTPQSQTQLELSPIKNEDGPSSLVMDLSTTPTQQQGSQQHNQIEESSSKADESSDGSDEKMSVDV